ncbi:MAG: WXG100 family type VII secretion target [Hamadaea sp.]|uniref:WXG100 family type VII secretion target n=1 Tax=Hamadaea sp. NPDC050747 TaxID=3155789 RepID=UPI0017FC6860|nr:WXG100 family type VII secretion target [Hamadaea sp.]NUR49878.1 WXG100 family type VII secretion target [Hamadaea sp.]NUT03281.1 WXG100 family type VII secretion target [Hamadaea sp.]
MAVQLSIEDLARATTQINTTYDHLNTIQTALVNKLQALYGDGWKGTASTKFNLVYNAYDAAVEKIYDSLRLLGELIQKGNQTYDTSELDREKMIDLPDVGLIGTTLG